MNTFTWWINTLAVLYVSLPVVAMAILGIMALLGKVIPKDFLDKLFDFGKWYMVSVAIVFAAKVLDTSFTDRETSLKEFAIYEKYATNILEADNIEKRWKLSEYFAAVTPSDALRSRWMAYKDLLRPEYEEWLDLQRRRNELRAKDSLSEKGKAELLNIEQKIHTLDTKLSSESPSGSGWIVVLAADTKFDEAEYENGKLRRLGVADAIIVQKGIFYYNISREFSSRSEAQGFLESLRGRARPDIYLESSTRFCRNKLSKDNYFICE